MGLLKTVKREVEGIVGDDGIGKLVCVKDGPSSCGAMDPRDSLFKAMPMVQGPFRALMGAERNRGSFPAVEADQRALAGRRFDPLQQSPVHFHIYDSRSRRVEQPIPLDRRAHRNLTSLCFPDHRLFCVPVSLLSGLKSNDIDWLAI